MQLEALTKEELIQLVVSLQRDELTNCYRRGYLSQLTNKKYVVAMIDIDGLKKVNDTQGHDAGDEYIKDVCSSINNNIRCTDKVVRWGGDEFIIVFDNMTVEQAKKIVARIPNVSVGVAEHDNVHDAIKLADREMYINKHEHHKQLQA